MSTFKILGLYDSINIEKCVKYSKSNKISFFKNIIFAFPYLIPNQIFSVFFNMY